ncbi:MAG TPA: nucleoside monophosphate kinase [Candidatus Paceibacterota bacterium]|nr:nucleoside monophosphate kinase [Candidatus Paceibacterota bacterium]
MTQPITVVFLGKSGSGKGTQAALLLKSFDRIDPSRKTIYVETGQKLRDFIQTSDGTMARKVKEVMNAGGFMPPFVPIWAWSRFFAEELKTGEEHIVCDGLCRQPEEPPILEGAFKFLSRAKPFVILLDVHHKVVTERLLRRGRFDDKEEKIAERLRSFETQAMPAVKYFEKSPNVTFVTVNGDQPIEKVHEDVLRAIGIQGRI